MFGYIKMHKYTMISASILFLLSFFGCLMILMRRYVIGRAAYSYLIWNLFLAWVPFVISIVMSYIDTSEIAKKKNHYLFPLGFVWLLFYPNAPYMITDFIHFEFTAKFLNWYDLAIFSLFIGTGFLLGFISMYLVYRIIARHHHTLAGGVFGLSVLLLSSYGIYLGRFMRWNSWDIFIKPSELICSVIQNVNYQSLVFSLIFALLLTLTYAFLYSLTYLHLEKSKPPTK